MSRLPDRPRGVRKYWKREIPDLCEIGVYLREQLIGLADDWGDPVEAVRFSHGFKVRRVEAIYANGKHVSLSRHGAGHMVFRVKPL
ncbi:MAG: hypothetical protein VYD90_13125 [Pseudomonadota bacterium]|uniref:hypothetical protein n=1 Tax=Novosphingobium sp. MBES04 TaxID=1206458 RepID=UPI0005802094|nr:hypothetical protein [Novosphingobium sp. MBES04]MED5546185.1 hypothetical protein [Pseudomonadota bacterium]GAM04821.1 hypothetical protein MBENS4_1819 [Novosphingobium sp. MBES04]